mgnify:CR=1 FL=1
MRDLEKPTERARLIHENMRPGMQSEVLWQFENMAEGGDGGSSGSGLANEPSIRESYYQYKTDQWFKDVLNEFKKLQRNSGQ